MCEKALLNAERADRDALIEELIGVTPEGHSNVPMLLRDQYGNFPLQTALAVAQPEMAAQVRAPCTAGTNRS